jgi:nitrite reductase (NADH) small subunit
MSETRGSVIPFPNAGPANDAQGTVQGTWVEVCSLDDLTPASGVAAMIGGRQIAIVRVGDDDEVYAVGNFDPFSEAFVIARGIVGDRAGIPKIASPIFKQSFDLRTGQCLDDPSVRLPSFPVSVRHGRIAIFVAPEHVTHLDNEETTNT